MAHHIQPWSKPYFIYINISVSRYVPWNEFKINGNENFRFTSCAVSARSCNSNEWNRRVVCGRCEMSTEQVNTKPWYTARTGSEIEMLRKIYIWNCAHFSACLFMRVRLHPKLNVRRAVFEHIRACCNKNEALTQIIFYLHFLHISRTCAALSHRCFCTVWFCVE